MKKTTTREIDASGRLLLPIELRRFLKVEKGGEVDVFVKDDAVMVTRHLPACVFCNDDRYVLKYNGKYICRNCINRLKVL